jgi:hypothetical protein
MSQVTQPQAVPPPAGPAGPRSPSGGEGGPPERRDGASWIPLLRLVATVVVVLVLAFGTFLVVSTFFTREHTETKSFPGPVSALRVTEDVGDVRVRTVGPGAASRVTAHVRDSFADATWSAKLDGSTLVVDASCVDDGPVLFNCSVDLALDLPAGVPVVVESDTGDLTVIGAFSNVDLATSTGDVHVAEAAGPVTIRTDTGDVRSLQTRGRAVQARTSTGDVRLSFDVQPDDVTAETSTGDVRVLLPADTTTYDVDTETDTGDSQVDVSNVPSAPRKITATTDTGDVTVTYR